jgi:DNA-binding response OmpR family regulator
VPLKEGTETAATIDPHYKYILLGEDDIDDEELLKEVFLKIDSSFSLEFVNNGRDVITRLRELERYGMPCLIVLDYNMPTLNGAEILQELSQLKRFDAVPKIIWSTSDSATYKSVCLQLGACDYVIKPSNMQGLTEVARYMLSFCSVRR